MGALQGKGGLLNALGAGNLLGDSLSGLHAQGGFGQMSQQNQAAQQQMNELMRHQVDAQQYAMQAEAARYRAMQNPYAKLEPPPERELTIRQELQKETDKWLATVSIN